MASYPQGEVGRGDDEGHLKADAVGAAVGSLSFHLIPALQRPFSLGLQILALGVVYPFKTAAL